MRSTRYWVQHLSALLCLALPTASAQQSGIEVTVGVVLRDNSVRYIPRLPIEVSVGLAVDTITTNLTGRASLSRVGTSVRLRSLREVHVEGITYSWDITLAGSVGSQRTIELTNDNARTVVSAGESRPLPPVSSPDRPESSIELFARVRRAVVRVQSGLSHGTGFIVDSPDGAIVTNDHVVGAGKDISVYIDSVTRVRAVLVSRDRSADVAVLKVSPTVLGDIPRLRFAAPDLALRPGERVYALGYPLNQEQTFTSGIVSGIRSGAILSDININQGNSGGPMLLSDGTVIGVNTFLDPGRGGQGVSGAISVSTILPTIRQAEQAYASLNSPDGELLPVFPVTGMNSSDVARLARQSELKRFQTLFMDLDLGPFQVQIADPVSRVALAAAVDAYVTSDRRKREARAGVSSEDALEPPDTYQWAEFAGQTLMPVVLIRVDPKIGETGGSFFKRLMLGANLQQTLRFKGDVRHVAIYRDRVLVEPVKSGVQPLKYFEDNRWYELRDAANMGVILLDPRDFVPRHDGSIPQLVLVIDDLNRPGRPYCLAFKAELTAAIWNNFAPLVSSLWPGSGLMPAQYAAKDKGRIERGLMPTICSESGSAGGEWDY